MTIGEIIGWKWHRSAELILRWGASEGEGHLPMNPLRRTPCRRLAALLRGPEPLARMHWRRVAPDGYISRGMKCLEPLESAWRRQRVAAQAGADSWLEVWRVG